MGAGIAQVALEAGWQVRLHDPLAGAVDRARDLIAAGLGRRAAKRGLYAAAAGRWIAGALGRLTAVPAANETVFKADLVIESIVEDLEAKRALFATLDSAAAPGTLLATNTSALAVTAIAEAAALRPERVLGLHFFNPAPVLALVEVVAGARTAPSAIATAVRIVEAWGRTAVHSTDSPGFIVNRVNRPFTIEALRMVESGEARIEAIDDAMRGDGFPMGPFELMDLVGLDVNLAAATSVWEGLARPDRLRPSGIQSWLVTNGRLGRKAGLGFYSYAPGQNPALAPLPRRLARPVRSVPLDRAQIACRIRSAVATEAALAMVAGVASEGDIDTALRLGAAHPEGPFAWARREAITRT